MNPTSPTSPTSPTPATPAEAIALGVAFLRAGNLDGAQNVFAQVLEHFPDHPDALHFAGILKARQGDGAGGIAMVRRAVALRPENAGAWNNLGNLLMREDRAEEAAVAYGECLARAPAYPEALANMGLLMRVAGDIDAAEEHYRRALAVRPDFPEALNNLGAIALARGDYAAAEVSLRRAVELEPTFSGARLNLGDLLTRQGRMKEAVANFWEQVVAGNGSGVAYKLLVYALVETGRHADALDVARRWIAEAPDDPAARHHFAALTGAAVPARAADAYVEGVFDAFAETFEASLGRLAYRAPALVAAEVARHLPPPDGTRTVLDAGCGTGLAAPLLKPYAARLDGMDLSAGMLERAAARGLYDHLEKAEITAAIAARPGAYDLIVCADTLCYFGDLVAVLAAAACALRKGGLFVFTVEALEGADAPAFRLHPGHGRYAHAPSHVHAAAIAAGLDVAALRPEDLRMEGAEPVRGLVVACRART
ncbi:tetratricopeptide repeat protein [Xanthobacter sp. AM11]|uniref:tetratricopeptide repeat protein n=1 Tax=Xanthobacter sp. AM11 TaxID=3380643 RepID=UPI0039BF45EE